MIGFRKSGEKKSGGLFSRLGKTRKSLSGGLFGLFRRGTRLSESLFEEIEDHLLLADMGVEASQRLVEALRETARREKLTDAAQLTDALRNGLLEILQPCQQPLDLSAAAKPYVIVMVGVNGVGKTTTLAKLAGRLQKQGHAVMLGACDTFRAAAIEQLQAWGERLGVPVIAQSHGADAAAVAFDAFNAASARGIDVLLLDTAGRQHTHGDLMEQLKKINRVLSKAREDLPHEVMLTVDAGTGQNALSQTEHFREAVGASGLCVTKLDGTAKGGVVVALATKFALPIRYIGVGEGIGDLREFDAAAFVEALLPDAG